MTATAIRTELATATAPQRSIEHTHWTNESDGVRAGCHTCGWEKKGNQVTVGLAAKRHLLATGHLRVEVVRRQWKFVDLVEPEVSQ